MAMMFLTRTAAALYPHRADRPIAATQTAHGVSGSRRFLRPASSSFPSGMRCAGRELIRVVLIGVALSAPVGASAQSPRSSAPTQMSPVVVPPSTEGPCVQVDVGGYRAGHLDCAVQRLQAAARQSQAQARTGIDVPTAGAPDVQVGVASQSGVSLRLGPNLGVSAQAWRPDRPAAPPRR
ncbi:hypothetical protein [Brevundimonas nasdae]|uniref:Uncharacterized protein n=1 Tax=Brevundimonas nasdae TaxID=172043 RepID=A0ABX8TI68_9CAUL|nr:hypothetical protein [Brevundimonas nasdae]QYC10699.1 hypothetical protein KWG56_01385 [Brevundimonas nasdae]QYC13486.1 hypothetical protein KWG63_14940 [Brevundimonas nasdae]